MGSFQMPCPHRKGSECSTIARQQHECQHVMHSGAELEKGHVHFGETMSAVTRVTLKKTDFKHRNISGCRYLEVNE